MTRIILVRHGQTKWNVVERFRGRSDIPLDETGLAQAEALGLRVPRNFKPDAIYTSPLTRARQTAEAIAKRCGIPCRDHPGLVDIDYGQWQGLTPD